MDTRGRMGLEEEIVAAKRMLSRQAAQLSERQKRLRRLSKRTTALHKSGQALLRFISGELRRAFPQLSDYYEEAKKSGLPQKRTMSGCRPSGEHNQLL
jgi:hypothetical protein